MLNENLKFFRNKKGLTQEEIAKSLKVTRQTISKWEKGISVPDADMLVKISDLLGVSVSELMGLSINNEEKENIIAKELSQITEQMAIRNQKTKDNIKIIVRVLGVLLIFCILLFFFSFAPM